MKQENGKLDKSIEFFAGIATIAAYIGVIAIIIVTVWQAITGSPLSILITLVTVVIVIFRDRQIDVQLIGLILRLYDIGGNETTKQKTKKRALTQGNERAVNQYLK